MGSFFSLNYEGDEKIMSANDFQRKIILDLAVSLDGYIEGANGEIDWCIMDTDMNFPAFLEQIDTILYGRKSYDLWGNFTTNEDDSPEDIAMWEAIQSKVKYVFSKTQNQTNQEAIYLNDNIFEEMIRLKNTPGKNIWLYGGASLITTFINLNLIDEFRFSIHPIILGAGKPIFNDIKDRKNLVLTETNAFKSGVVQLVYTSLK